MRQQPILRGVRAGFVLCGIVCSGLLVGCNNLDRAELTQFYTLAPDAFEFRATSSFFRGVDDSFPAETERLEWLAAAVDLHAMCAKGYEVTSRQVWLRYESPLGFPVSDIAYRGRCRA
jgi:hypothetical protein